MAKDFSLVEKVILFLLSSSLYPNPSACPAFATTQADLKLS